MVHFFPWSIALPPSRAPFHLTIVSFFLFSFFFFLQRSFPRSVKTPAHRAITFHRAGKSIGESWVFTVHRGRWRESTMKSRKTATSWGVGKGTKRGKGRTDNYLASRERSSNGRLVEDVELEKGSNPFAKRAKDNLDRSNRPRIIYYIRLRWYEQRSVACFVYAVLINSLHFLDRFAPCRANYDSG